MRALAWITVGLVFSSLGIACTETSSDVSATPECVVGGTRCDGLVPETCGSDGRWQSRAACTVACSEGACVDPCEPGERRCDGPVLQRCDSEGIWESRETCDYVCTARGCTGECAPGSKRCDGLVPETCDESGAWKSADECPFTCTAGECTGRCVPGTKTCDGIVPQTCGAAGAWQSSAACAYVCTAGACTGSCVPGTRQCDGLVPQSCDVDGAWESADACPFVCSAGACTGSCVPGTKQCSGLVPQTCDDTGAWQDDGEACPFVCGGGECTGVCVPDDVDCDGLVPRTCDASGTWQGGEACPYVCDAGACTGECAPGDRRCADGSTADACDDAGYWQSTACLQVCSTKSGLCACAPGYDGDGVTCTTIDFCSAPSGGCSPDATCSQDGITPACTCDGGLEGDGLVCYPPTGTVLLDEGFDDISTLAGVGWSLANRSAPLGILGWFQGTNVSAGGPFDAMDGAANAYIGVNYNSTTGGAGTISNWLATPAVPFGAGFTASFYTRSLAPSSSHPDRIEVRLCTQPSCEFPSGTSIGDYTTLLGSVNPTLSVGGYPSEWTKYTFSNTHGIPYSGEGRIAVRYFVTGGGPVGANSDYIGIDRFVVTAGVPAFSVRGTVAGLVGSGLVLWLNGSEQRTIAADGSFSFTSHLQAGTPYSVSVYQQPAGATCVVTNASGTVASANVGDVVVTCTPD